VSAEAREARLPLAEAPREGEVRIVEIRGRRIGVYRVGEALYALADRCPHRGAPLCAGSVATAVDVRDGELVLGTRNGTIRCPWHKWEFDIASGRALADERLRVRRYPVRVQDGEVVVSLDAHPAP
jgi:nitrite reductase/ring-hydroxylating ferredoxin subunit